MALARHKGAHFFQRFRIEMTISRSFITEEDSDIGVFGFMPRNMPAANAGNGISVAHDTMEHIFGSTPSPLVDEILAIGASTWLRFLCPWADPNGRVVTADGLGASVGSTLIDAMLGTRYEHQQWTLYTPPVSRPIRDDRIEQTLVETAERGIQQLKAEAACALDEEADEFIALVDDTDTKTGILYLLRQGYRGARKRYNGLDPYEGGLLFTNIAKEVDELLNTSCTSPGIEIKVSVSPKGRKARINLPRHIGDTIYVYA